MVHTDDDDWNGTNYLNHWRAEDQAEGQNECELDMGVTWTGFTIFEAPRLYDEIVEPETTDLTAKPARPFPIPIEPTTKGHSQLDSLVLSKLVSYMYQSKRQRATF